MADYALLKYQEKKVEINFLSWYKRDRIQLLFFQNSNKEAFVRDDRLFLYLTIPRDNTIFYQHPPTMKLVSEDKFLKMTHKLWRVHLLEFTWNLNKLLNGVKFEAKLLIFS